MQRRDLISFGFVWFWIALATLAGMFLDIQEIDATQYACMAREMLDSGSFFQLFDGTKPYLDKPPLTFWCTAFSYFLFGVSNFAFRLPSVLFGLWAIYSTYRLARLLHGSLIAHLSAVVLASCQALFLMNNDVKTDMYLLGPLMFAVWKIVEWARGGSWREIALAAGGVGLAMLAKGPIALVIPSAVLMADLVWRKNLRRLVDPTWLLGVPVLVLVLLPFCWGQYHQYGAEGVRFFLWTQSFGRITGESEWTNDASAFFFVHTFAWAFLPWTPVFIWALFNKVRGFWRAPREGNEITPLFGFVFVFAALSLSRFKLPHYIFIVAPFAAILVSEMIVISIPRTLLRVHQTFLVLMSILAVSLTLGTFPDAPIAWKLLGVTALLASAWVGMRESKSAHSLVLSGAAIMASINLMLNLVFYPGLLSYQSTAQAGKYLAEKAVPASQIYAYRVSGRAYNFYSGFVANPIPAPEKAPDIVKKSNVWVYTDMEGVEDLASNRELSILDMKSFPHFRVNRITLPFLNPSLRPGVTSTRYLLHLAATKL
jgi:4-amino-4-deoxy-L-arabinose transferase-like glycosyltransferase